MATLNVKLSEDSFIHFTYVERAKQIVEQGVLLANPPHDKFGIAGVQAVSVLHGQYVPGVQITHLNDPEQEVVAVHFTTNTMPKVGYPEEVIWPESTDVRLLNSKIISQQAAVGMLKKDGEDFTMVYESAITDLLS